MNRTDWSHEFIKDGLAAELEEFDSRPLSIAGAIRAGIVLGLDLAVEQFETTMLCKGDDNVVHDADAFLSLAREVAESLRQDAQKTRKAQTNPKG